MNDDQNSVSQDTALPRPPIINEEFQPAPPRQVMTDDELVSTEGEPWSFAPGHDEAVETMRPAAPWQSEQSQADALLEAEPLSEPSEQPRPIMAPHGEVVNLDAADHGMTDDADPITESVVTDEPPCPAMVEQPQGEGNIEESIKERVEEQKEPPVVETPPTAEASSAVEVPPDTADLVTVEEAVLIFRERGLPRHMRTIQKYCSRTTGRVLVSYQVPTENGIRYMIERSSIDRFIANAAQQAPTGKLEQETIIEPVAQNVTPNVTPNRERPAPVASVDHSDIFENPIVQRLEAQVERLESRNEQLQSRIQNVLIDANERLIELQKANAIAQSENLGTFLLEAERIRRQEGDQKGDQDGRHGNDHGHSAPVNREGEQFAGIGV